MSDPFLVLEVEVVPDTPKAKSSLHMCTCDLAVVTDGAVFPLTYVGPVPSCTRYYSLLDKGDKNGAYGYVAQLFDGTQLSEVSRLTEESFKLNMEHLVRVVFLGISDLLRVQQVRCGVIHGSYTAHWCQFTFCSTCSTVIVSEA